MTEHTDKPIKRRRSGNNDGTVYQTTEGKWRGAVSFGHGSDGKLVRRYVSGRTKTETKDKVRDLIRQRDRGITPASTSSTVKELLETWLETVIQPNRRYRTYMAYKSAVDNHLVPVLGRRKVRDLTAQHVQALLADRKALGLRGTSLAHIRTVLRMALNQAMRWDMVERNVAVLTESPAVERFEAKPLAPDEVTTLLAHSANERLGSLWATTVTLGLRKGEVLGLQWAHVDLTAGTLRVRHQLQWIDGRPMTDEERQANDAAVAAHGPKGKLPFVGHRRDRVKREPVLIEPKTAQSKRQLPIPGDLVDALRRHRTRQLEERLRAGAQWDGTWDLVFCTPIGAPLDSRSVSRSFQESLTKAGLESRRFHDLRHSCGSFLAARGVHPRIIMEILGHATIAMTMNVYAHVELDSLREALAHTSNLFPPPMAEGQGR